MCAAIGLVISPELALAGSTSAQVAAQAHALPAEVHVIAYTASGVVTIEGYDSYGRPVLDKDGRPIGQLTLRANTEFANSWNPDTGVAILPDGSEYHVTNVTAKGEALALLFSPVGAKLGESTRFIWDKSGPQTNAVDPISIGVVVAIGLLAAYLCAKGTESAQRGCFRECKGACGDLGVDDASYSGGVCGIGGDCSCNCNPPPSTVG